MRDSAVAIEANRNARSLETSREIHVLGLIEAASRVPLHAVGDGCLHDTQTSGDINEWIAFVVAENGLAARPTDGRPVPETRSIRVQETGAKHFVVFAELLQPAEEVRMKDHVVISDDKAIEARFLDEAVSHLTKPSSLRCFRQGEDGDILAQARRHIAADQDLEGGNLECANALNLLLQFYRPLPVCDDAEGISMRPGAFARRDAFVGSNLRTAFA